MEPYTELLLGELYDLDRQLAYKLESAIADEREAGYQAGWNDALYWAML